MALHCWLSSSIRGWSCTPEHGACTKTHENQNRNQRPQEEGPTRRTARSSSKSSQAWLQLCRDSAPSANTVLAELLQGSVEANQTLEKEKSNPTGEEASTKEQCHRASGQVRLRKKESRLHPLDSTYPHRAHARSSSRLVGIPIRC